MKSDFLLAITQLSAEKNLPKEIVLSAVENALVSAYRREYFDEEQNISVKLNTSTTGVEVWAEKTVVTKVTDDRLEISLANAKKMQKNAKLGDSFMVESTPANAGRIAAQTAKQVILQRLHEAEHSAIFEEFADREGDVVTGIVQRVEQGQIFIDLGRTEAILPISEQVRTERYRQGQRLKVILLQVMTTPKGPRVVISRSHPNLLRRLFEMEVPEVYNGTVEIKAIAREAGFRSKVAVASKQEGIDPVGCCVGLRGIRIQNIVNELNGERIDVIMWDDDPRVFIANALSPAHIVRVDLSEDTKIATVTVPDRQLSLAIGKEGQNARLAAKLAGCRIDIMSASIAETERKASTEKAETVKPTPTADDAPAISKTAKPAKPTVETEVPAPPVNTPEVDIDELLLLDDLNEETQTKDEPEAEEPKLVPFTGDNLEMPAIIVEPKVVSDAPQIRFAEDIVGLRPKRADNKSAKKKGKKKKGPEKDRAADQTKTAKPRSSVDATSTQGDDDE
ncbi:transcription termination factor NusA [Chloroflexota bacterium]